MWETIMKEALIGIIRQERVALEAQIAAEMRQRDPDDMRIEALREEASDLRRQLERYEQ
jgi:capsule polysaccharide export protein KpsE/RkpR